MSVNIMDGNKRRSITSRRNIRKSGRGLLNKLIDKLPIELHFPGFNYCGPGARLSKRLQRGDKGINPLDEACKVHDIAYSNFPDTEQRNIADRELGAAALRRLKASDSGFGEKLAALGVTGAMKMKTKFGMGLKRKRRRSSKKQGGQINLAIRKKMAHSKKRKQRILPVPKQGGFLPLLLPILGALGALGGGAAGIAKAVNDAKANREQLAEQQRHNQAMEKATQGKGFYLRPYKGKGFYLNPYQKKYP